MNLYPGASNSPMRSPQVGSSNKTLQLTPIWEEVVKNHRLPPDVNQDLIFKEISFRLENLEWPVRQHAFRVLYDIIPVLSNDRLDENIIQNNILRKLVMNLGHPAPGIRKVALETIQKYFKETSQSEKVLDNLLQYGVIEKDMIFDDQAGILRENITLGTIMTLVDLLKPFIVPQNDGNCIPQKLLIKIFEALANQISNPNYREECLETLWKLRKMFGEDKFFYTLNSISEKRLILDLMNEGITKKNYFQHKLYVNDDTSWSDETKSDNSFELFKKGSFDFGDERTCKNLNLFQENSFKLNENSEDCTDGTDTETYTKEPTPTDFDDHDDRPFPRAYTTNHMSSSFVPIDYFTEKCVTSDVKDSVSSSPRIVLEAEIQFSKNKAISMKVLEEEAFDASASVGYVDVPSDTSIADTSFTNQTNDLFLNYEQMEREEKIRTPRKVRFGGEVIKLRTPDSDTTDITIEIQETDVTESSSEAVTTAQENPSTDANNEKLSLTEPISSPSIHIPLPISCASKSSNNCSDSVKSEGELIAPNAQNTSKNVFTNTQTFTSSSSSEPDEKENSKNDEDTGFWMWSELRLVEENILKDLKMKEDWKIQYEALEQLKAVLNNPKKIETIEKQKNDDLLKSLFRCLLFKLPRNNNHQVAIAALSVASQLIETLPKDIVACHIEDIVLGLCQYVGGCKNLTLKIESVQSLKMLFGIVDPSTVVHVLLGDTCLLSSSSKMRENSLLAIMYATMTFPSNFFNAETILEKVMDSSADVRRRVRYAALEAIAVLSQFCSTKTLISNIARVTSNMSAPNAGAQLIAAIQARLSRRLLPTISSEGLVLYALQIPASRRFGNAGSPIGADVDWILSGTGSISTGSAKSKTQLNAASQRLDLKVAVPLSPKKWAQTETVTLSPLKTSTQTSPKFNKKATPSENPWTIQKNRHDFKETGNEISHFVGDVCAGKYANPTPGKRDLHTLEETGTGNQLVQADTNISPKDVTWALIPLPTVEESNTSNERSNNFWGDSANENANPLASSLRHFRPLYLKLQPGQEQLLLSRASDDIQGYTCCLAAHTNSERLDQGSSTEIKLLTPTALREKNSDYGNTLQNRKVVKTENASRIPVLLNNHKNGIGGPPSTASGIRKMPQSEENFSLSEKPLGWIGAGNGFIGSPAFLPSIHSQQADANCLISKSSSAQRKVEDTNESALQDTMNQFSGLLTVSKETSRPSDMSVFQAQSKHVTGNMANVLPENISDSRNLKMRKFQNKVIDRRFSKNQVLPNAVTSAPAIINCESRGQTPSTSGSNSTDFETLSGSELRLRRLTSRSDGRLPYRNYNTYNPKTRTKKEVHMKSGNKAESNTNAFPENLKPMDKPKEGLETCLGQLESQQWEVNMLGLTSLIRLVRHHPATISGQLHPIMVILGRHIRNLRSQVARTACQASAEIFLTLKRNVEPDLEELSGPLFHRCADTNRFIRADCNDALDNMTDNVGHAKALNVIISKGTMHQNAAVRAVAARLLLRLTERVGSDKLLSLPKEVRDKMLQAGANLLTEGKLETRAFAKQIFREWSSHPSFSSVIVEAIPPNLMRLISKTLISIKS